MFGRLSRLSDVVTLPASEVHIASPYGVALQADGEAIGATPAVVTIAPARIRMLWPENR
jgi:diacylglycerol kinase family enzyme